MQEGGDYYNRTIQKILRATEANMKLFDVTIRRISDFTGSISQLLQSLAAVPAELPTKKPKPGFFGSAFSRKKKAPTVFDNLEPNLTTFWTNFAAGFLDKQPGIGELNDTIKSSFIESFVNLRDYYAEKAAEIKLKIEEASRDLKKAEANYTSKYNLYCQNCSHIEELKAKHDAEIAAGKSQDQIIKLIQALGDAKTHFKDLQDTAIKAQAALNNQKTVFGLEIEAAMGMFEELDLTREEKLHDLMQSLGNPIIKFANEKQNTAEILRHDLTKLNMEEDLDPILKLNIQEQPWSTISFEPAQFSFDITEFIDPKTLFEPEIHYFGAKVVKGYDSAEVGDILLVTDSTGELWNVINENTKQIGHIPADHCEKIDEMTRRVHRAKCAWKSDCMEVREGDCVMSVGVTDDGSKYICVSAYGAKGEVPREVLE